MGRNKFGSGDVKRTESRRLRDIVFRSYSKQGLFKPYEKKYYDSDVDQIQNEVLSEQSTNSLSDSDRLKGFKTNSFEHKYYVNDCPIFAVQTYFPKKYSNAPQEVIDFRNLVYSFKDGLNTEYVLDLILKCLRSDMTDPISSNFVATVIPASTEEKTELRFKKFIQILSEGLNIQNGYDVIQRSEDRATMRHLGHDISRVDGISFKSESIRGMDILLFDDVITKGSSFFEISSQLKKLGARSVFGLFLAKTYDAHSDLGPFGSYTSWLNEGDDDLF